MPTWKKRLVSEKPVSTTIFPEKTDLGLAYCKYKTGVFSQLDAALHDIPPGVQRLRAYLDAFAGCAEREEMCGVYAMLSDSHQFSSELQKAVSRLAQTEMLILKNVLTSGQKKRRAQVCRPS
ncbi:Uncharacterised protein [Klebsiella pneumoniae]|uniref:Uncharacterized protein n=1 Tax=Klebsiella pneumoniae TaxID=573 RepID=A0A377XFP3_KLEPN|nr:Uncharacterised protein [Klebsiella pneumoniae]